VGRLGSGPHVVGRIGSGVRVSASFHMFALRKWRPSQFTYAVVWSGFRDRVNCGKLALTRTPDPNRPMRRGPDPSRSTSVFNLSNMSRILDVRTSAYLFRILP